MGESGGNVPHDLSQRSTAQQISSQAPPAHTRIPVTFNDQARIRPIVRAIPSQTSPRASGIQQGHLVRTVTALPLSQTGARPARSQTPGVAAGQWVLTSPGAVLTFTTQTSAAFLNSTQTGTSQSESGLRHAQTTQSRTTAMPTSSPRLNAGPSIRLPAGVAVGSRVTIPASRQGTSVTITTTNAAIASSRQSPLPEQKIGLIRTIPAQVRPVVPHILRPLHGASPVSSTSPGYSPSNPPMVTIKAVAHSGSISASTKPLISAVRVIPGPVIPQVASPSVTAAFIRSSLQSPSVTYATSSPTIRGKTTVGAPMLATALTFEKSRVMRCDTTPQAMDLSTSGGASQSAPVSPVPVSIPLRPPVPNLPGVTVTDVPSLQLEQPVSLPPVTVSQTVDAPHTPSKIGASPRPSILRKRELDSSGSPLKASRNLSGTFGTMLAGIQPLPTTPVSEQNFAEDTVEVSISSGVDNDAASDVDVSPRKKPRKQLLQAQEIDSECEEEVEQDDGAVVGEMEVETSTETTPYVKLPRMSLLESFNMTWKPSNNHFLRYSDVKAKDEKRPTVTDLANQKQVLQTIRGWNVYRVESQLTDIGDMEAQAGERFRTILQALETQARGKDTDRVVELLKGNLQRCKVIHDQIGESKTQIVKIFDHKSTIEEVIQRYTFDNNGKLEKDKKKK